MRKCCIYRGRLNPKRLGFLLWLGLLGEQGLERNERGKVLYKRSCRGGAIARSAISKVGGQRERNGEREREGRRGREGSRPIRVEKEKKGVNRVSNGFVK